MKTSFKVFLVEQNRTRSITKDEAYDFINKHCPKYLNNIKKGNRPIFRGINVDTTYIQGDSSQHVRKSAYTKNYYTLILDYLLPSWQEYPNRSQSFVCTGSIGKTIDYGNNFAVFPKDGTEVGVCPDRDIWTSFSVLNRAFNIRTLEKFNNILLFLFESFDIPSSSTLDPKEFQKRLSDLSDILKEQNLDDEQKFHNMLERFDRKIPNREVLYSISLFLKKWLRTKDFITIFKDFMDPEENGFKILKSETIPERGLRENEMWFAGPAVL